MLGQTDWKVPPTVHTNTFQIKFQWSPVTWAKQQFYFTAKDKNELLTEMKNSIPEFTRPAWVIPKPY